MLISSGGKLYDDIYFSSQTAVRSNLPLGLHPIAVGVVGGIADQDLSGHDDGTVVQEEAI